MARRRFDLQTAINLIQESSDEESHSSVSGESHELPYDFSSGDDSDTSQLEEEACENVGGIEWWENPRAPGRESAGNVVTSFEGKFVSAIHPNSPIEAFEYYLSADIDDFVRFTNLEARRVLAKPETSEYLKSRWIPVDRIEMNAFIGVHLAAGVNKQNMTNVKRLFDIEKSSPLYGTTMPRERFEIIRRFFRCDDKLKRDGDDKLSPVRFVFERKLIDFQKCYSCSPFLSIDEQLLRFHGRLSFRMYIPSKPERYGIKIIWLVDNDTGYVVNGLVYTGQHTFKGKSFEEISSPRDRTVMVVCEPVLGKGANITMDNWFTSISVAQRLHAENTTLVGTLRRNSRCIPSKAKECRGRERGNCRYFFAENFTLLSMKDRKRQPILLLSSQHHRPGVRNGKPEIVDFYNRNKSGVDNMDHMLSLTSSARKSNRWTYGFLFNLIDVTLLNAFIMFTKTSERQMSRSKFLDDLCMSLCRPQMQRRLTSKKTRAVRIGLELFDLHSEVNQESEKKRGRCKFCSNDNKHSNKCRVCCGFTCKSHGSSSWTHFSCE